MRLFPSVVDRPRRKAPEALVVALVEPDPYLAFLIRMQVPEARVLEIGPDVEADEVMEQAPALVVLGLEQSAALLTELLERPERPKILAVADAARAARSTIPSEVDGLLARPFVPAELSRAVRSALGVTDELGGGSRSLEVVRRALPPLKVATVAVAAVLEVGPAVPRERAIILLLAFLYTTIRWAFRPRSIVADAADVAVGVALIAATGGLSSPYIPFAAAVVGGIGLTYGPMRGATAGIAIVAGSTYIVIGDLADDIIAIREVVAWLLLFPLLGLTGGFAARVWRAPAQEGLTLLIEANRVLSSLYRIARTLPGGLEIGSVAEAAMAEIREMTRAKAGAMLVAEAGTLAIVGGFGLRDPSLVTVADPGSALTPVLHGTASIVRHEHLPAAVAMGLGDVECWLAAPMRRGGVSLGALMAACPSHQQHSANLLLLQRLADEVAVAVENAQLFATVREISIDEERRRLARELHDGVAQALTHLRYELEFIGRHGAGTSPDAQREITRLSRVAERAAADVRSMILGLRASVSAEGLMGALRSYVRDLRGLGGPEIVFEGRGEARLRPEIETEVFRIAQEAVSNALRHAGATTIKVSLLLGASKAVLTVEDDGVGVGRKGADGRKGVGLDAMRERAELIGAALVVGERPGGGTQVRLEHEMEEG